ncbi:acetylcholinesterase-1-like [Dermacentor variabilis]|uniref:acetylcholinesterase-1-like n=1 Tax=Dermacentor variabilis TaxID=34621 RepID=UPI003F5C307F
MYSRVVVLLLYGYALRTAHGRCYIFQPGDPIQDTDEKIYLPQPFNVTSPLEGGAPTTAQPASTGKDQLSLVVPPDHMQPVSTTTSQPISTEESPIVETNSGPVQGQRVYAANKSLYQFVGIPFAEPPLGPLRFRNPVPIKPWTSVYQATKKPFPCLQTDFYINSNVTIATANSTEDCLYLNVWTPSRECVLGRPSSCVPKTVIVYIYGGTFSFGSSGWDWYDGKEFVARGDVVMVSMNYRVGPMGFFHSGTLHSSGNAGLHDQLLAMKWVKQNIRNFGGDPDDVTLVGQSAGAISIGLHLVSPLSKGLFNRIIMESGSPYFRIADNTREGPHKVEKLARALSCASNDMTIESHMAEMVECLRKIDGKELLIMSNTIFGVHALTFFPVFGDDIIPDDPYLMMEQKKFHKADLLIGNNLDEGSYFVFYLFGRSLDLEQAHKITKYEVDLYVSYSLQMLLRKNVSPIRHYYLSHIGERENIKALQKAAEAVGDFAIICPTKYFAESFASMGNKVHYYYFTHRPSFSTWPGWVGPTHGDEVFFVMGLPFSSPTIATDQERELSKLMIETWTTFAKTGKVPDVASKPWPEFTAKNQVYMELNPKRYTYGRGPNEKSCNFWKSYLKP